MSRLNTIRDPTTVIPLIIILITNINLVIAQTNNKTCSPANCTAMCIPNCNPDEACILKTMTDCGICPTSRCMSRAVLGLPPLSTTNGNNSNSTSDTHFTSSNETNTGALVGGIVGGLIGLGVIIGISIYCYSKRGKKKRRGKLPPFFAYTSATEEKQQHPQERPFSPHPAVIAALSQQRLSVTNPLPETAMIPTIETRSIVGLSDLTTAASSNNNPHNTTTTTAAVGTTLNSNIPEEFESRIALQNRRISELLHNNPRLSQLHTKAPIPTADDNNGDKRLSSTLSISTINSSLHNQPIKAELMPSVQVIQVTRAKPQIMRVNSVRTVNETNNNGLLSRSASVRTILTAVNNSPTPPEESMVANENNNTIIFQDDSGDEDEDIQKFPSTPNNRSFATTITEENPFHDNQSFSSIDATASYWNNSTKK
ncbi:MAG: hypothetical protein EXX96DRAFT_586598 [Benjaminiella poitrasii]|nr:MAG: hypothetical protein EXX96DRAFT_586598 [Benjaminiella poitrasii]